MIVVVATKTIEMCYEDEKAHAAKAHNFRFWCKLLGIPLARFRNFTVGGRSVDSRKDPWFTKSVTVDTSDSSPDSIGQN